MILENFHHLFALLSQLKIVVLDQYRKDAKQKYSEALSAYVTRYFGRPLEKLNVSIIHLYHYIFSNFVFNGVLSTHGIWAPYGLFYG